MDCFFEFMSQFAIFFWSCRDCLTPPTDLVLTWCFATSAYSLLPQVHTFDGCLLLAQCCLKGPMWTLEDLTSYVLCQSKFVFGLRSSDTLWAQYKVLFSTQLHHSPIMCTVLQLDVWWCEVVVFFIHASRASFIYGRVIFLMTAATLRLFFLICVQRPGVDQVPPSFGVFLAGRLCVFF